MSSSLHNEFRGRVLTSVSSSSGGNLYVKPDESHVYTAVEPTLSSNPNVFFQRGGLHPGMIY